MSENHADTQVEQLRRIQSIADAALAHLELDALLAELMTRIAEALQTDTVAFLLLDEETNELVARAALGIEEEVAAGVRIPFGKGFAGRIAAERVPVFLPDVDRADIYNPILRQKGIKSLLGVPLFARGTLVGVLHVGTLTPRVFTESEVELLQFAGDRAALAIDHGRAYAAEKAIADRLRRVQAVTDVALSHLASDELLGELVLRVRDLLDADTCAILLMDEDRQEVVARAAAGLEEEVEAGVRIPIGGGFAGRIAATGETVFLPDVDHADVLNPILREKGIRSLLGAPLLARGRVLGVIHVGSLVPRTFTSEEIELLEAAAERAALGIERALLHERLLELDRLRHQFVATASHELRTPTTAILGSALTLEARRGQLTPDLERELQSLLAEQSRRLATLIDQLLDVSRLDSHAWQPQRKRRPVRDLVEQALVDISPEQRRHVAVQVDPELELEVDPVAFERIVSNLVVNALRHGAPPVVVTATSEDGRVVLDVVDAGAGVPEDVQSRVFEQFARSESRTGTPGSGLGLAIARSYAVAHGGDLTLEQNGAPGARFRLVLPGPTAAGR